MARGYVYRRPVKRSHYSNFRRYLLVFGLLAIAFGAVAYFIYSGLHQPAQSRTSAVENTEITGNQQTFTNDYFQFQDTGTWVIDKHSTGPDRIVYHKFRKNILQAEMIVYINQTPIALYSETPLVLPIRIVNDNSFQTTTVSNRCVSQYAKGELHKVREVSINNAVMLCDPDSTDYYVIISEIGGDYRLHLKRHNGTPIQFVITYKDVGLNPQPDSLINIAGSFKTR